MRSADSSGVGAERFSAVKGVTSKVRPDHSNGLDSFTTLRMKLSPITLTVALTAMLAATLFVIYDTVRTLEDSRMRLAMIGKSIAADISEGAVGPRMNAMAVSYAPGMQTALEGAGFSGMGAAFIRQNVPTGRQDSQIEATDSIQALMGVAQRGAGAYGLAFMLIAVTWRRRKTMEMPDALQRYNYHTMASAIPMGIACWTKSGKLIVCNDQYRERLSLVGTAPTYHEAVKQLIVGGYMKLIKEDNSNRLLEVHRENGSCLLIDERPLDDGGFMTLVSDVTERKRVDMLLNAIQEEQRLLARRYHEEKLKAEAASRAKTNFLAHLSHDIRTPLNHIIGFADLMRHQTYGPLGDPRYVDYVQSIKTSGEHLLASFATILDLAELESGQKVLRTDPVAVDDLIDQVALRFRGQASRAGIALVLGEKCGAVVRADRLGMQRMLSNIIENAVRFTKTGGRVTIAAFAAPDGVVLEVTDTGIGMSEERLGSLSQPFALGDATFTREGVGPGLGIPIARAIAEQSGGHLAIDSSLSLGTTVAISLPIKGMTEVVQAAE